MRMTMAEPARREYSLEEKAALVAEMERIYQAGGQTYGPIAIRLGTGAATKQPPSAAREAGAPQPE
jgi:hypothetical protein